MRESYHHGDLRLALIDSAAALLAEQGIEAFSLRATARRAGVSAAAPAYHFGDAAGLLTAVAMRGFAELAQRLTASAEALPAPADQLQALGRAYLQFAVDEPARFQLMFRKDKLRITDELRALGVAAFAPLQQAVCGAAGVAEDDISPALLAAMLAAWSMVHGFAHLALDGQFERFAGAKSLAAFCDACLPLAIAQLKLG
jgi:AcrR family transcriptional regulator